MNNEKRVSFPESVEVAKAKIFGKLGKYAIRTGENEENTNEIYELILDFTKRKKEIENQIFEKYGEVYGTFNFALEDAKYLEGSDNFQVSICRPEIWALEPEQIAELFSTFSEKLSIKSDQFFIGFWPNGNGKLESEISFSISHNESELVTELATVFNQEAIMDWNYKENGEITNYDLAFISNPFYKKDAKVDYIGLFEQIGGDNNEQSKF